MVYTQKHNCLPVSPQWNPESCKNCQWGSQNHQPFSVSNYPFSKQNRPVLHNTNVHWCGGDILVNHCIKKANKNMHPWVLISNPGKYIKQVKYRLWRRVCEKWGRQGWSWVLHCRPPSGKMWGEEAQTWAPVTDWTLFSSGSRNMGSSVASESWRPYRSHQMYAFDFFPT